MILIINGTEYRAKRTRVNKFPCTCVHCGKRIKVMEGRIHGTGDLKYIHFECTKAREIEKWGQEEWERTKASTTA